MRLANSLHGLLAFSCFLNDKAGKAILEDRLKRFPKDLIVLNDEHAKHFIQPHLNSKMYSELDDFLRVNDFQAMAQDARIVVPTPLVDSIEKEPPERWVLSFIPESPSPFS